jgi:hypothetical protein
MSIEQYARATAMTMTPGLQLGKPMEIYERPAFGGCVWAVSSLVIDPGQSVMQASWRDIQTCYKIIVVLPLSRFHCMTPLIRRAMFLLLCLTLSNNGLGAAFAQNSERDCCRNHAAMAAQLEGVPCRTATVGRVPCEHDGPANPSPMGQDAPQPGVDYCPHCVGPGASGLMFLIAAGNAVDALTVPYEAPPYIGTVIPDERPKRLERPPAASSLS